MRKKAKAEVDLIVQVDDNWRVVRLDKHGCALEHRRLVTPKSRDGKPAAEPRIDWVRAGYYGRWVEALSALLKRGPEADLAHSETKDLRTAIDLVERWGAEITRATVREG